MTEEGEFVDPGHEEGAPEGEVPDESGREDYYRSLRTKWEKWMEAKNWPGWLDDVVLFIPDFFYLLVKMFGDVRICVKSKMYLGAGITYYIWPLDFLPDILGPLGYIDDLIVAAMVLNLVLNDEDPAIAREHWPGDGDVIEHIQAVVAKADDLVGAGALTRLRGWIAKKTGSPPG